MRIEVCAMHSVFPSSASQRNAKPRGVYRGDLAHTPVDRSEVVYVDRLCARG